MSIDERELRADLNTLCVEIGERLAGSPAERNAATYFAQRLRAAGISNVETQSFPCTRLRHATAGVSEPRGSAWHDVEALPYVGAPSTPGRRPVEGDLVWLTLPESQHRLQPGSLQGAIAVIFGPMPSSATAHRRLVAAQPAAVVHVDERFPFPWLKADGAYPYWIQRYGMPTTVGVPYMDAWRWRRDGVKRLRVRVDAAYQPARSHNVIGEIPGTNPRLPALVFTSHLDTQPGNCGADDNAAGVACVLALARRFAGRPGRRTLRFIAFGTEEQLSVGAMHYVRHNRINPANTGLVLNFDSTASPLGHFVLWTAGDARLGRFACRRLARGGVDALVKHDVTPFADCFPFNRMGIPSLWTRRVNFPGGRWQHHSRHDTLENISVPDLLLLLPAAAALAGDLASRATWPFQPTLSPVQRTAARRISRELLGW